VGIVVVTGTSTGIGFATAITLARGGHTVFAGMRNLDRGDELREVTSKEKLPLTIVKLDVDDDSSVEAAFKGILQENGHVDALINNAGILGGGPVEEVPMDVFRKVMETNFFGALRCMKAVLPSMRERQSGCFVNVTSIAGQFGLSPQGAYTASKWALEGLSECLAHELSPFKIRVAIVEPGFTATRMTTTPRPAPPPGPYSTAKRRFGAIFAESLKTLTSPFEVAKVIQDIVDGGNTKLRIRTGDGNNFVQWRKNKNDEEWVRLGAADDAEWAADIKRNLGLDIKLQ
jgi:NAD(P)-dependent dehydrogenase (short-subunit alcohol dehydrogenase family)